MALHDPARNAISAMLTRASRAGRRGRLAAATISVVAAGGVALTTMTALGAFNAVITQNGTFTAASIILKETQGANTCYSTGGTSAPFTANSSSCTTIDVFGAPVGQAPGSGVNTQTMTFQNVGSATASSFTVAAPTCSAAGSGSYYGNDTSAVLRPHRRYDRQRRVGLLLPRAGERLPSSVEHGHARDARDGDHLDAAHDRLGARVERFRHDRRQDADRLDERHQPGSGAAGDPGLHLDPQPVTDRSVAQ